MNFVDANDITALEKVFFKEAHMRPNTILLEQLLSKYNLQLVEKTLKEIVSTGVEMGQDQLVSRIECILGGV